MLKKVNLNDYLKFNRRTEILYEMIRKQRPPIDKMKLSYDNNLKTTTIGKVDTKPPVRKMKKIVESMAMLWKVKTTNKKELKNNRKMSPLAGIEDQNSRK